MAVTWTKIDELTHYYQAEDKNYLVRVVTLIDKTTQRPITVTTPSRDIEAHVTVTQLNTAASWTP